MGVVIQKEFPQCAFPNDVSANCQTNAGGGERPRHRLLGIDWLARLHED